MTKVSRLFTILTLLAVYAVAEDFGWFTSTSLAQVAPTCTSPILKQRFPAAAFGTTVYLAVWSNGTSNTIPGGADIYCARIQPVTGVSLDPAGILVCSATNLQRHPKVAFDGTNFLVVWEDFRSGHDWDIYAARVTQAGQVLDPNGFAVNAGVGHNQMRPAVGFANGNYLVAWMDGKKTPVYGIYGARVTPAGQVPDTTGFVIDAEDQAKLDAAVPANGRWDGKNPNWFHGLCSRGAPSIAVNGNVCLVAYNIESITPTQGADPGLGVATINPATGSIVRGPVAPWSGGYSSPVLRAGPAAAPTPSGWVVSVDHVCLSWGPIPLLTCVTFDSLLVTNDAFTGQTPKTDGRRAPATADYDELNGYSNGKGNRTPLPNSAVWNGSHVLIAKDYIKQTTPVQSSIIFRRVAPTGGQFIDSAYTEFDASSGAPDAVNDNSLCAGPNGEALLLYEKFAGTNNRSVVFRVIKEK